MSTEKSITIKDLSIQKKVLLYFDYLANVTTGGEPTLSPEELDIAMKSTQTEKGSKLYKKFLAIDPKAKSALQTLLQARLSHREQLAIIDGLVAIKEQLKDTEALFNEIFAQIKDEEQRKKLTPVLTKKLPRKKELFWMLQYDPEREPPDVKLDIFHTVKENGKYQQPISIDEKIRQHKAKAETALIYFKTFLKAVKDSMRASGFQVARYLDLYSVIEGDMKDRSKEAPLPDVYPDYKTAKIDEAQYKFFREKVL